MRKLSKAVALVLLVVLSVPTSLFAAAANAETDPVVHFSEIHRIPSVEDDDEAFRRQMLTFLHDMDAVLIRLAGHPVLNDRVEAAAAIHMLQVPLSPATYEIIEKAPPSELMVLREAVEQVPETLLLPTMIEAATRDLAALSGPDRSVAPCQPNEFENARIISLQGQLRTLRRTVASLELVESAIRTIAKVVYAATQDTMWVGGIPALPLILLADILNIVLRAINFAVSEFAYQEELAQLCIASCLNDADDEHGNPSQRWRYRGCDNRDNNCEGGIDETEEDLYPPDASIDATVMGQCFRDTSTAGDAVLMAINAQDDCSKIEPEYKSVMVDMPDDDCRSTFSASVRDAKGNVTTLAKGLPTGLTVDGEAPVFVERAMLEDCYPTLAAARHAFAGPDGAKIYDCTDVETRVDVVEKECAVDLVLTAVDSCGNEDSIRDSVRVDGAPPVVNIERLTIPAINGLSCFDSEAEALAIVKEATRFSDECTAVEDLGVSMSTSGPQCDLRVEMAAEDQCENASFDALVVRVDSTPPVVSCALATNILYPATDELVDVGFTYSATDECDPAGPQVEITVTSDEPTALAYSAIESKDPYPDAVIERAPDGTVVRVLVRNQASKSEGADGRIYRLRVTATDSCGLQSKADCFVSVPRKPPGPGSAVNSGQIFDATVVN